MSDISKNIRRQRMEKGMSQTQLAEKLCVTRQTVSSWERGVSYPDIKMLESIAVSLDVDMDVLLYPASYPKVKQIKQQPLSFKFVLISLIVYFIFLTFGGVWVGIPLMQLVLGGSPGPATESAFLICWGLILLVAYIAICTCLISEYFCGVSKSEESDK